MIYNNLIYFLVVLLILSTSNPPDQPQIAPLAALGLLVGKFVLFSLAQRRLFDRSRVGNASLYADAERKGSILAIVFFAADIYLLDCQYYFARLPLAGRLPVLADLAGLSLFLAYLALMWIQARPGYDRLFGRSHGGRAFVAANIKTNLPTVLPWVAVSLFADLLRLLPIPGLRKLLASTWGEGAIFLCFFGLLVLTLPLLITKIWDCRPLPPGPVRRRIEAFCQREGVEYAEIMIWPLFEGQALTAGVMGLTRRFRYLLITPALLATLTEEEIEAVIAHETGHVKHRHLQLYLLLFLGFGLVAQFLTYPLFTLLTGSDLFYQMIHVAGRKPSNALALASTIPMFLLMVAYFRYLVGFFMRNFERQADLYALRAMGRSAPLERVFDKIAMLSGNSRDLPSWHHFGIGERIDFLRRCESVPGLATRHNRKVGAALMAYTVCLAVMALALWRMPDDLLGTAPREQYAEAVIRQKIAEDPNNFVWHQLLGDLQYSRKKYRETIAAYTQALVLSPDNAEALNNLAWLLLTAEDTSLRDPAKALELARQAVILQPVPHILDTLALAYWSNGHIEQAILAEERALLQNPPERNYYTEQIRKFSTTPPPN